MKGFFRLWIVLAFVVVPGLALWQFHKLDETWNRLDQMTIHICVSREGEPNFDVDECIAPAKKTVFQHENTTPGTYWGKMLGFSFAAYLTLTGMVIGIFYVFRWVVRGFATSPKSGL
jgi:hypothetical protein